MWSHIAHKKDDQCLQLILNFEQHQSDKEHHCDLTPLSMYMMYSGLWLKCCKQS